MHNDREHGEGCNPWALAVTEDYEIRIFPPKCARAFANHPSTEETEPYVGMSPEAALTMAEALAALVRQAVQAGYQLDPEHIHTPKEIAQDA